MSAQYSNRGGFTLIEFMVAIVIMMVGLLALLQSVNIAIANNGSNKKRSEAVILADQAMGRERITPFANITSYGLRNTAEFATLTKKSYAGLGFVNYSVFDKVTKLATSTKNVQITVTWREKGVRKTHALTTVLADIPVN